MGCLITNTGATYTWCTNCNGSSNTVAVMLEQVSQTTVEGYKVGAMGINIPDGNKTTTKTLRVKIPAPLSCDLTVEVRINYSYTETKGSKSGSDTTYQSVVIKQGTTSTTFTSECYKKTLKYVKKYITILDNTIVENRDYALSSQRNLPMCGQPSGCAVRITSVSVTGVTFLGGSDGAMKVNITGSSGGTKQYSINGGAFQSSQWFTNLPAATYSVRLKELSCRDQVYITVPAGQFETSPFTVIEPSGIVAAENPITVSIGTEQYQPDVTFSTTKFNFSTIPSNNFSIKFNLPDYVQTFTAKDLPVRDTFFLTSLLKNRAGTTVGSNTIQDVAASFAECFINDQYFNTNYFINQSGTTITLKAKDSSGRFDLTNSNIEQYKPDGVTVITSGVTIQVMSYGKDKYEGSILNDYNIVVETYYSDAYEYGATDINISQFNRITEQSLPFSKDNNHLFDISSIAKNFVRTPKPNLDFTGFTTMPTFMKPFILKYGERFPLVFNETTLRRRDKGYSKTIWVCNSSLDLESSNDLSIYTGLTGYGDITSVEFLTSSPAKKTTYRTQKELLYFILPKNYGSDIMLKGYIYFWDGTSTATTLTTITTGTTNFGGVNVINTSYDKIGLDVIESNTGKKIKQLDVAVYTDNGTNQYSKVKTYYYPYHDTESTYGVCFLNKLGTFETFNFIGERGEFFDRKDKSFTSIPTIQEDGSLIEGYKKETAYDVAVTKKVVVNTGDIDRDHAEWLIELLSSNEIYSYTEDYENYLLVDSYKDNLSSKESQFNIEIVFRQTGIEQNVSV